eukprot:TRINITY_DN1600_c0_g1_i1.p1 TRINITY_DN1600_c0_g1~~TRINITY_DN1600_c0_g1_i1.p1  ORF type:complete len:223 (-),score=38.82 TRINITY_DN1600_c0_g1_i1:510-1178(-)
MDLFFSSDTECRSVLSGAGMKLRKLPDSAGEQRRVLIQEVERDLDEAQKILRAMTRSVRDMKGISITERNQLQSKCNEIEEDIAEKWKTLSSSTASHQLTPNSPYDEFDVMSDKQRSKILQTSNMLEDQNDRLNNTHRVALETEEIGSSVLTGLGKQRGQLEHARDMTIDVDNSVTKADGVLKSMSRRIVTDTLIQILINVVLVAIIGLIIFVKWIYPHVKS